jgi:K+ transporter
MEWSMAMIDFTVVYILMAVITWIVMIVLAHKYFPNIMQADDAGDHFLNALLYLCMAIMATAWFLFLPIGLLIAGFAGISMFMNRSKEKSRDV